MDPKPHAAHRQLRDPFAVASLLLVCVAFAGARAAAFAQAATVPAPSSAAAPPASAPDDTDAPVARSLHVIHRRRP